jgi:hypothetical protein
LMLGAILPLGGCWYSTQEVWSLTSGEKLPFVTEKLWCADFDKSDNGSVTQQEYWIAPERNGEDLRYNVTLFLGDEVENPTLPMTIHKVEGDLYIVAFGTPDKPDTKEMLILARITPTYMTFLVPDNEQETKTIARYALAMGPESDLEGGAEEQRAFVMDMAKNLTNASIARYCTPE